VRVGRCNQVVDGGIGNISFDGDSAVLTPVIRRNTDQIVANSDVTGITEFDRARIAATQDDGIVFD